MQAELGRVLYPVFLHTYLDLVDQGAAAAAAALMARHRRRFTEAGGRTSKLRMQVRDSHLLVLTLFTEATAAYPSCACRRRTLHSLDRSLPLSIV